MQEEVSTAAETSDAFSDETLKEHAVFQHAKQAEMKEMLSAVADGQIEMYQKARLKQERPGSPHVNICFVLGNGKLGEIDTANTAHKGRRVN